MNQPYEWPWQGRAAGFCKTFLRCLRAAQEGAAGRPASACGSGRKLVAYSILFQ
jgi:hypothetical protein